MEEAKIAVLTVLKKGTTLKNIFLNTPPPETKNPLSPSTDQDLILIGRHPDCHIVVDHPSISRFHLEIHPNSTLQKLIVTDRSSVHGTWVSGKKIEPNIPVELWEGDTLRLGASTRVYCLHWMPLSHAFEMEMPLSPLMEEGSDFMDSDEVLQYENSHEVRVSDTIPLAPPLLENLKDPFSSQVFTQDLENVGPSHSSCFSSIAPLLDSASFSSSLEGENRSSENILTNALQTSSGLDQKTKPSSLSSRRNKLVMALQIERTREENRSEITSAKLGLEIKERFVGAFAGENDEEMKSTAVLTEVNVEEEDEEPFSSDKENRTPANSISSKLLKSCRRIDRSFILCNKDDLEIEEHIVKSSGEVKIPSGLLAEGSLVEKSCRRVDGSFSLCSKDDLEIEEHIVTSSGEEKIPSGLLAEGSLVEKSCRWIDGSFSLCSKDDLEIEEHIVTSSGEEKIPLGLLAEGSLVEKEEEIYASDKASVSPVNSNGYKELKRDEETERSPMSSFGLFNKYDFEIDQQKHEVIKRGKEEPEDICCSDTENLTPEKSIEFKRLKNNREFERLPLCSLNICKLDKEHSDSKKVNQIVIDHFQSSYLRVGNLSMDENEVSMFCSVNYVGSLLSPGTKLQRSLFKADRSPLSEKKNLNVEEICFLSDKEKTPKALNSLKTRKATSRDLLEDKFRSDRVKNPEVSSSLKTKKSFTRDLLKAESKKNSALASDKENFTPQNSKLEESKKVLSESRGKTEGGEAMNAEVYENNAFPSEDRFLSDEEKTHEALNFSKSKNTFARNLLKDMLLSDKEKTPEAPNTLKMKTSFARDPLLAESEENEAFFSDKENLTPQNSKYMESKKELSEVHGKTEGETMNRRKERTPFRPLLEFSPLRSSTLSSNVRSIQDDNSCNMAANNVQKPEEKYLNANNVQKPEERYLDANNIQKPEEKYLDANNVQKLEEKYFDNHNKEELPHMPEREKKKWYFVVDVGCLLNEESRKSLQLLEGIRGTQLIIPRIVIRELDHLKRCQGILSRGTKASSILQWIEECMVKSSWWIHVQSTSETFPAAPTPPVTPRSLCDGSTGFSATSFNLTGFSTCGSLMEIVSPTTEDHILDCALLFKRIKSDGQLILLTSSTTLRIKAMAEGLLCETSKEFRDSLVNPFSKRFLWMESCPRGSTWSCFEEVPIIRMPKGEGTSKGLKLILI